MFPGMVRMIAEDFTPNDSVLVRELSEARGGRRPILRRADLSSPLVGDVQYQLRLMIGADIDREGETFLATFGREATERLAAQESSWWGFQMHLGKTSAELANFLIQKGLAWKPDHPDYNGYYQLHPKIGQAVLGSIAVACAKDEGLDIVAQSQDEPSQQLNQCLAADNVEAVYDHFVRLNPLRENKALSDTVLLETIVYCNCDVSKLDARGLAALMDEREALAALKRELHKIASTLPTIANANKLQQRLSEEATDALKKWEANRLNLSSVGKAVFGPVSLADGASEIVTQLAGKIAERAVPGTTAAAILHSMGTAPMLATGAGLVVGFAAHVVSSMQRFVLPARRARFGI